MDFEQNVIRADGPSSADKPKQYDRKLSLTILPPAPALHISFTPIPGDVLAGEIIPVTITLFNAGTDVLTSIFVAAEDSRWVLVDTKSQELPLSLLRGIFLSPILILFSSNSEDFCNHDFVYVSGVDYKDLTNETISRDRELRKQHSNKLFNDATSPVLKPKEGQLATIWIQAPFKKGQTTLKLLFYYGTPEQYPKIR